MEDLNYQRELVTIAAERAIAEYAIQDGRIEYRDVLRDVLLVRGGIRPGLFSSSKEALLAALERLEVLRSIRAETSRGLISYSPDVDLRDAFVRPLFESDALELQSRLHYLRSPRSDALNLGLFVRNVKARRDYLLGLATLSPCDVPHILHILGEPAISVMVLSRVVVVPRAPRNSASRLLGRVFHWLRLQIPEIHSVVTYNNPNLGFTGALYKATNWKLLGSEKKKSDMLLDGEYVTLRELNRRYGTFESEGLQQLLAARITVLPSPWFPLEIYCHSVRQGDLKGQRLVA